jgi:hypothetical protein
MPRKGKCFSTCRKRPKSECDHPECHYTNGNKYKYCRLAFTRKMNEDCVPVLRNKPYILPRRPYTPAKRMQRVFSFASHLSSNSAYEVRFAEQSKRCASVIRSFTKKHLDKTRKKKHGSLRIQKKSLRSPSPRYEEYMTPPETQILDLHPTKEDIDEFRAKYTKNAATRKIGRFLRRTDPRVRSKFLQSVCSDAGVCIAFGTNAVAIRKHFDDFNHFGLLSKPAIQIGSVSANGFVKELTYMHRGYMANAVLKSSVKPNADNLLYEAVVGFFLNKMSAKYPTFVETYGLYEYKADGLAYNACKDQKSTNPAVLSAGLTRIAKSVADISKPTVKNSCLNPISMAVLIQHLKSAKTLHQMLENSRFVEKELLFVLYQVYMTLASLSDIFTHYDLHFENVLVYEPVVGSHIEYHYHTSSVEKDTKKTAFRSKYIAKIIDYGRCYFNDQDRTSNTSESKSFHDNLVCKECKPRCGAGRGYEWFDYKQMKNSYFICSQRLNPSHDLRLLYMIGTNIKGMDPQLQTLIGGVVYGRGVEKGGEMFGTVPNSRSGRPNKIHNVKDAFAALEELVKDTKFEAMNEIDYRKSTLLGELHIYGDKPMRWIPSTGKTT